ncbi:MAG TPA: hypothetical protein VFJ45_07845 [bacterium]|nr:hypothetical protein [bacterium]
MPFPPQTAHSFTLAGIEKLKPGQVGCYGIFRPGTWIYVGYGDVRACLLAHLHGHKLCILKHHPTRFVVAGAIDPAAHARALIAELRPVCNVGRRSHGWTGMEKWEADL